MKEREFHIIYEQHPITRLLQSAKNLSQEQLAEIDKAIISIKGPQGELVRNILQSLYWTFEGKTYSEMWAEMVSAQVESMRFEPSVDNRT